MWIRCGSSASSSRRRPASAFPTHYVGACLRLLDSRASIARRMRASGRSTRNLSRHQRAILLAGLTSAPVNNAKDCSSWRRAQARTVDLDRRAGQWAQSRTRCPPAPLDRGGGQQHARSTRLADVGASSHRSSRRMLPVANAALRCVCCGRDRGTMLNARRSCCFVSQLTSYCC